ncbi:MULTISPECIES: DUF2971 domain-containing protein [Brevundimonas]|uniref:DUF2971 domain-containing protein n=1 Tax=Brevundimonas TaxID=41275 RepID=UPI0025BAE868|nr:MULTISPECIES: DUF2971 domain-containing protein [Brevundimonas]
MTENNGLICKYLPENLIDAVFTKDDKVTLKFSKPNEFNDPYELFLAADFNGDPEMLACFSEAIGELPQYPTTCFSRSPIVMPMWAHYAQNQTGFAIVFSEEAILEHIPDARFDDVSYSDTPSYDFSELVARVLHIGKPRYTYFLRNAVVKTAYFNKAACWQYEQERRMVVGNDDVTKSGNMMLMNVPAACVSKIVVGARADNTTRTRLQEVAKRIPAELMEMKIGRSSAVPYLVDEMGRPHSFVEGNIIPSERSCSTCSEPINETKLQCVWCQIPNETKLEVANRNPYRLIASYGGLENYIAQMDSIGRSSGKK